MFNSTEEFFNELFNHNRLKNTSDFFMFKGYEQGFYLRLIEYLQEYEDNTQSSFIDTELWGFQITLEIIETIQGERESDNNVVNSFFLNNSDDDIFNKNEVKYFLDLILKHKTKNEYRTIIEAKKSIEKIILFLNQKKLNQFNKDEVVNLKKYISTPQNNTLLDLPDTSTVEKKSFINNFDNVHESKVIDYFTKNLVDKKYITVEVLNEYLKQAFELKKPPTQRFSFTKLNTQGKIKIVFYEYFKITAGKPIGRKKEYVELLGEYFTGFDTSKLMTNFSK